jgi:cell wall-associated NlpC family hydrolase
MASKVGIAIACVLAVPLLLAASLVGIVSALTGSGNGAISCTPGGAATGSVAGYGADQLANAATITTVGKQLQIPEQGWVVAIAVAIQESTLRNLDHGDRDSLGLFQQRPSQGWGTPAQILDPTYAATQFYRHLQAVPGWQQMSLNDAAQTVQRSGTPNAYGQHEKTAEAIVEAVVSGNSRAIPEDLGHFVSTCAQIKTGDCAKLQDPTVTAMTAISYACQQLGVPYEWGGNGAKLTELSNGQTQVTGGFDCSGLTKAAYAAAGVTIPRTAQTQYNAGPRVPAGAPILPGDLVFFGAGASAVTHVGIAISAEYMIDAPHEGAVVRIERIWRSNFMGAARPGSQADDAGSR